MDLETLIVAVFCLVDDFVRDLCRDRRLRQRGPAPVLADSEVLTVEIVGEFLGLAAAPRMPGPRPGGNARRQHAGAGLPLRPRAPLPEPPWPERVRARPRGAPDLLRAAAAPAHRLARGGHRGRAGASDRGRLGG